MISLLVVNYRSADLAAEAIRSARAATREELHVVVVDNSCDRAEADRLRPHARVLIAAPSNVGYAGGINLGRASCRGDIVVIANPDVVFFPNAIDHLVNAFAEENVAVAGPALFWDDGRQWFLPPADDQTLLGKIDEVLASRIRFWRRRRDRRRFRGRLAFWSSDATAPAAALSGAVMAVRLRDFDRIGGFDERFSLYFEENDFIRRIRRSGRLVVHIPAARCRHVYNQSAGEAHEHAAAAYAASELAYFSKWYSGTVAKFVKGLERAPADVRHPECGSTFRLPRAGLVVEASPLQSFATAAGHFPRTLDVDLPDDVWRAYKSRVVYLRALDGATGEVVAICVRSRS